MIGTPQQAPPTETVPLSATILPLRAPAAINELRRLKLHGAEPVRTGRNILQMQVEDDFADKADIILHQLASFASECREAIPKVLEPYPAEFVAAYDRVRETLDYHWDQEEQVCRERTSPEVEEALAVLRTELGAFQRWIDGTSPPDESVTTRLIA